jgi:hypothetical protein
MLFCVARPVQPLAKGFVPSVNANEQAVLCKVPLEELYNGLRATLCLRVRLPAQVNVKAACEAELLKLLREDYVPIILVNSQQTILVKHKLLRHPAQIFETTAQRLHELQRIKFHRIPHAPLVP